MNSQTVVKLIEEMINLKIQHQAQAALRVNTEVARVLQEKRIADEQRLEHIRTELIHHLNAGL